MVVLEGGVLFLMSEVPLYPCGKGDHQSESHDSSQERGVLCPCRQEFEEQGRPKGLQEVSRL